MSKLDKQALREAAERAKNSFIPNFRVPARDVLALLDELETKEEQRANWFRMAQKLGDDLDTAERLIAELDQRLIEYAGIATREARRVAELEARTVKLPKPIIVLHRRDFTGTHRVIYAYPAAELNAVLAAAGIKVIEGEVQ
ncbi:ead/Ea22-like family protein [Salmonella enterica]|uniref:ead/Ea22-like family protein n=1 Tax=Salmonella enterica TaxID=28901 RepID=UPI0012E62E1A|nr:ead/Ea22-like family protein [Salmonella enterica subsp. enterica serovar Agbeni]EGC2274770.1 ead/Ea22-like family protein [Salmonella enterica subsp. enterica serovar Agbeni]EHS5124023.1 ead/Ea22-like family protein [Salmonella enterica subsp. enterica serovar Agbeni]